MISHIYLHRAPRSRCKAPLASRRVEDLRRVERAADAGACVEGGSWATSAVTLGGPVRGAWRPGACACSVATGGNAGGRLKF